MTPHDHPINLICTKVLQQNPTSTHDKTPGEFRRIEDISQHNKENIQPTANIIISREKLEVFALKPNLTKCSSA